MVVGDDVLDVPHCELSDTGKTVENQIQVMSTLYSGIHIDKYIIMPNHVHIIVLIDGENGTSRTPSPTANAVVPRFISTMKRYTNKICGASMWQRSYHDHIIRNETEYKNIWEYIDTNLLKWELDEYYNPR